MLKVLDNEGNGVPGIVVKFETSTTDMDEKKVLDEFNKSSNDDGQVVAEGHVVSHDAGVFIISASIEEPEQTVDFTITMLESDSDTQKPTDDTQDETTTETNVDSSFIVAEMTLQGENLRNVGIGELVEPFIVILKDKDGNLVRNSDNAVFVQFTAQDGTGKNIETVLSENNDDGECHASFTKLTNDLGAYAVSASLYNDSNIDLYGDLLTESVKLLNINMAVNVSGSFPGSVRILSGDNQETIAGTPPKEDVIIQVFHKNLEPYAGIGIELQILDKNNVITKDFVVRTDDNGKIIIPEDQLTFVTPGQYRLNVLNQKYVNISVIPSHPFPSKMDIISGDLQEGFTSARLAENLVVEVRDQFNDVMTGINVTFSIKGDDGSLSWNSNSTDTNGLTYVDFTLGKRVGDYLISATVVDTRLKVDFLATAKERTVVDTYEGNGWTAKFTDLKVEEFDADRTKITFMVNLTVTAGERGEGSLVLLTEDVGAEGLGPLFQEKGRLNGSELTVWNSSQIPDAARKLQEGGQIPITFVKVVPRSEVSSIDDVNYLDYFYVIDFD